MEKIDELRFVLNAHDRSVVSLVALNGIRETTNYGDSFRSFADSGDVAFVILGPKEKVNAKRIENKDEGSVVYTFTLVPPKA